MKQLGLFEKTPRSKYKSYKGEVGKTAPNLLLVKKLMKLSIRLFISNSWY